jgi:hypothetical protein
MAMEWMIFLLSQRFPNPQPCSCSALAFSDLPDYEGDLRNSKPSTLAYSFNIRAAFYRPFFLDHCSKK